VASVIGLPLPLHPLQILYLNVLTDVFPALALGVGRGDPAVMERPPRPAGEPVLTRGRWLAIGGWSLVISGCVLTALAVALHGLGLDDTSAVTISFLTLACAKLWFVFNLTEAGSPLIDNEVVKNLWIWAALALCAALLAASVYLPPLAAVLRTTRPSLAGWETILGLSAVPFVIGQARRLVQWLRSTS
jgi:Ca2+-transporting ATPase